MCVRRQVIDRPDRHSLARVENVIWGLEESYLTLEHASGRSLLLGWGVGPARSALHDKCFEIDAREAAICVPTVLVHHPRPWRV